MGLTSVCVKSSVGLGDLVVDSGLSDHGDEDMIGLAHNLDSLRGDFADDSDTQARAREGMSADELLVDAQLASERSYFVLEAVYC
jgi:hypothetical protein